MKRNLWICALWLATASGIAGGIPEVRMCASAMITISGKVINDESAQPVVTTVRIRLKDQKAVETSTNDKGIFSLTVPEVEECSIIIRASGFEPEERSLKLKTEEAHHIEIRLTPSVKIKMEGKVMDAKTLQPLNAFLRVYRNSDFIEEDSLNIREGSLTASLTDYGWYILSISCPGYLNSTDTLWVTNNKRSVIHRDYRLNPIEVGFSMKLHAIHFETGTAKLDNQSFMELDQLVHFFNQNPSMEVEIAGHTDNTGEAEFNYFLSQSRAESVVKYLIEHGVSENQVKARGYGESKPIDTNATPAGRASNRRVEMVVTRLE